MQFDLLISVDWDYYRKFMSVNMDGALVMTRAVYPEMQKRGGGAIVNQRSTAAYLYSGFYGLAKVGINGLTQQLAHELGGMNIRVNAIAPGPTDTAGHPHPGRRRRQGAGQGAGAQADGPARGHGRRLPVPALRRGVLGDRPDHRRRRRTDVPGMTARSGSSGSATSASRWRCGSPPATARALGVRRRAGAGRRAGAAGATAAGDAWPSSRRASTCVCVMVRDDDQVREVLGRGRSASAADGPVVVDPLHGRARRRRPSWRGRRPHGVRVLDAPVSGGPMGAADGTLAIMVGGSEEAFAAARAGARR